MLRVASRSVVATSVAIAAIAMASTVTAWASPCLDGCPVEAARSTDCCAGAHTDAPVSSKDLPVELSKPLPDCCTGGAFLGCAAAADLEPLATESDHAAPIHALVRERRLDWTARRDPTPLRGLIATTAPPGPTPRTTVLLL